MFEGFTLSRITTGDAARVAVGGERAGGNLAVVVSPRAGRGRPAAGPSAPGLLLALARIVMRRGRRFPFCSIYNGLARIR